MTGLLTNVVSIKLRKLNDRYRKLYQEVRTPQQAQQELELEKLRMDRRIFNINRELDQIEEEVVTDLYTETKR